MASVSHSNQDISVKVYLVDDLYTEDAIRLAEQLVADGVEFDQASVDRFAGLVLSGPSGSWHFNTLLCGYEGNGPAATAQVLHLFGFGSFADMFARVNHGGDMATAVVSR